jgi:indole-3-glycerol phosphate synthase
MTILDNIVATKKVHVEACKKSFNVNEFEKMPLFGRKPVSLKKRFLEAGASGIIAEFKRKSPSKGIINDKVKPEEITLAYQNAGVSGVSILTDEPFFGGTPQDLTAARNSLSIPILRKDFIIDEYQILEAKAMGADLILLIAAILTPAEIKDFAGLAKSLGLEILFEVHDREELDKVCSDVTLVGVNNRNLKTFVVDIQQSVELAKHIPSDFLKVSESGIEKVESIKMLKSVGYNGFLIGENFMKNANPGEACKDFINELRAK